MLQGLLNIPELAKQFINDPLGTLWNITYGVIQGMVQDVTALAKLYPLRLGGEIANGDVYGAAKDIGNGLFTALTYLGPGAAGTNVLKGVLGKADDVGRVAAKIDDVGDVGKATSHVDDVAVGPRRVADDAAGSAANSAAPAYKTWNEFQSGTAGQYSTRAKAAAAWSDYKDANGIVTSTTRSIAARSEFLRGLAASGKSPSWMNQWLKQGKVPPGYHVNHIKPLSVGGPDTPSYAACK